MSGIARKLMGVVKGEPAPGLYLLRTITGELDAWVQFTDDISTFADLSNSRLVFEYRNGDTGLSFRGDIQVDAVDFDGTFFSFEGTGESWETSANGETSYESVVWQTLTTGGASLEWNVDNLGTGSSGTGRSDAANGSYYVYAETSGADAGAYFWLRSPTQSLNANPTLSYSVARFGDNIGTLKVYLEVL